MDIRGYNYSDLDKEFKVINQSGFDFNQNIFHKREENFNTNLTKCVFKNKKIKQKKK